MMTRSDKRDLRRFIAVFACGAALGLMAPAALAGSALNFLYGEPETFLGAEINAMGSTGAAVFRGGASNVLNPAMLADVEGFRIDAGLSLDQRHEDRFTPLWDSFGNYVVDTAIASNREHGFGTGFGFAADLEGYGVPLACGVSLTDRYSFGYDFQEDIRNPTTYTDGRDLIIEERELDVAGTLRDLSLGLAYASDPRFSFGAAVHYAFGNRDEHRLSRDYETPANSTDERQEFDMDGVNFSLGARFTPDDRLTFGFSWETPLTVDGDTDTTITPYSGAREVYSGTAEVEYPSRYSFGMAYYPRNELRTVFTVDMVISNWSDLTDNRFAEDPVLEDTYDVRIGLQHTFYNGVPMRFGFRHVDSYADVETGRSSFSAGIGKPLAKGMIDVSVELGKVSFVQEHWFDYPAGYESAESARVEETHFRLGVGYVLEF